jgi:hypothetical protein
MPEAGHSDDGAEADPGLSHDVGGLICDLGEQNEAELRLLAELGDPIFICE